MKKRLISFLLTLVMVVSLCPALATNASADAQVTTVTLNSGDTVVKLCQNIGVDYYAHKNLIMSLNGFTSEGQFSKMAAGSKVVLPVSNAAAASLSGSGVGVASTTTTPIAGAVVGTGAVTGTTTSIPTGDYASYYLVGYTIQPGETISGIYNNWGLSYKTYSNQILKLNNLANYNSVPAGKLLILPTTNPAIAGSNYITVMAHVMRSGDSAYNIICTDYGLNYNAVQKQVQALNNRENLGNFMVGEVLYIPVTGLVSSNTTVTPGTGSSSSNAIINGSAAYNLVSQTPSNGNFALIVDGNAANAAVAGKTVEIVATPNAGYAVSQISVTKVGDPNTSVTVQGNKFVMPSYSVSVSVSFSQAIVSNITVDNSSNGSVSAMVNSAVVSSATAGSLVTVKTIPATGFMLDTIRVTYNEYRDTVAVENGQFIMPTFPVTVSASFKVDPNFDPTRGHNIYVDALNAKVETKLGDTVVTSAKAGDRISLNITPDANYTVQNLVVYYDNFKKTVDVEKNAFTMPDGPITIVATVKPTASAVFAITKVVNTDGNVSVTVNGQEASSANVGATVKISGSSTKAYYNYIPSVFKTGDTSTTVPVSADGVFTMPDFPVTVSLKFYVYHNIYLDSTSDGWFNVLAALNNTPVRKAGAGVELKVVTWGYNQNTHAPGDIIVTFADGSVHNFTGTSFIMPDCDIRVRVNFNPAQTIYAYGATSYDVNGKTTRAYNAYYVNGVGLEDNGYAKYVKAGEGNTVVVTPAPALGYVFEGIKISYYEKSGTKVTRDVNKDPVTGKYQFEMPSLKAGSSLELNVIFRQIHAYKITLDYEGSRGKVLAITSIGVVTSAAENTKVNLAIGPYDGYSVDAANLRVTRDSDGSEVLLNKNDNSFFMPKGDVTVHVPFKTELNRVYIAPIDRADDNTTQKGMLNVLVNSVKYTESQYSFEPALGLYYVPSTVKAGTIVTVINESAHGYILDANNPISITSVDGSIAYETVDRDKFTFVMPNADVTITANYTEDLYNIVAVATEKGSFEVPKQGNRNVPVKVSNIVPNPGYELDQILVTYTDCNGMLHKNMDITAAAEFIPEGQNIPQGDVVIEVTFKPVLNPITIKYLFNGTASDRNFAVDLMIDGMLIDGINRGNLTNNSITDVLAIKDENGAANGKGLPTGATIVIKRQDTNMDENFFIKNMWIMHNAKAIQPEYSNNQYHFKVPYVESGLAKDLELYVEYSTDTAQDFRLEARPAEGSPNLATAEFTVGGAVHTYALPNEEVEVKLTAGTGYVLGENITVVYQNSDGVDVPETVALGTDGTATFKIPTLPKNNIAYVEYTLVPIGYKLSYDSVESGGGICTFYQEDGTTVISDGGYVRHGSKVIAKLVGEGYVAKAAQVICNGEPTPATQNADGNWEFVMPMGEAKLVASYDKASYKLTKEITGDGTVEFMVDGAANDGASITYGTKVTLIITPAPGSVLGTVKLNDAWVNDKDADGNFVFNMPFTDSKVSVGFQSDSYALTHGLAIESVAGVGYTISDSTIAVGKDIVVEPDSPEHVLSSAVFNYTDASGNPASETVVPVVQEGKYIIKLSAAPKSGTAVDVKLVFVATAIEYALSNNHSGEEDVAELKFYSSDNKETRGEPITKALNGSTVYGELKVRYNKAVDGKKLSVWDSINGSRDINLELDRVSSDGISAYYKFKLEMPKADVGVNYVLVDVVDPKVNLDNSRAKHVGGSIALGSTLTIQIETGPIPTLQTLVFVYAKYVDENGTSQKVNALDIGNNNYTITLPSTLPRHNPANNGVNLVDIVVEYVEP